MNVRACGRILVSDDGACKVDYDVGYECKITGIIEVKLKFTPEGEQVTSMNRCIFYSGVFRKPSPDFPSHLGKVPAAQFNCVWGCFKPPVGPGEGLGGDPGGEAPRSSEDTVIYCTTFPPSVFWNNEHPPLFKPTHPHLYFVTSPLLNHFKDDRAFRFLTLGTPSDFCIMHPLVPVVKILKKNWGHRKNLGESGGQSFKGSDREKF